MPIARQCHWVCQYNHLQVLPVAETGYSDSVSRWKFKVARFEILTRLTTNLENGGIRKLDTKLY